MKFKVWDKTNNRWLFTNCGLFLLDQNGELWFKEELPASDGQLVSVKDNIDYEIIFENIKKSNE